MGIAVKKRRLKILRERDENSWIGPKKEEKVSLTESSSLHFILRLEL